MGLTDHPSRLWLVCVLSACVWGCKDPPNGPGPANLPLTAGRYSVSFIGFDLTTDPRIEVCSPIGIPPTGKNMQTLIDLRQEGGAWIARSVQDAGDIVIRLEGGPGGAGSPIEVRGTATGTALWADPRFPARDLTVTFHGSSAVSGELTPAASFINGRISGNIAFSNSAGQTSNCPMVLWTMQRAL